MELFQASLTQYSTGGTLYLGQYGVISSESDSIWYWAYIMQGQYGVISAESDSIWYWAYIIPGTI